VMWMKEQTPARVVTFGFKKGNDIRACHIMHQWPPATRLHVEGFGQQKVLNLRLLGRPMAYAVLGAIAVAMTEGFSLDEITPRIENMPPMKERLEPIALNQGAWIISDTFKGQIETMTSALDLAAQIPATRRIIVLGLIDERTGPISSAYGGLGEQVGKIADLVLFVGGKRQFRPFRSHAARVGLPREKFAWATKAIPDAMAIFPFPIRSGDLIIVKGRGSQRLERITLALTGENVQCQIKTCKVTVALRCHNCPMLTRS
jgi:UDP-N-acetylmuramyl pentapeptide synthase